MADEIQIRIIFNHIPGYRNSVGERADRALRKLAERGVNYTKESMRTSPATGRLYGRRGHIASSPGNPPRVDMANLINSIRQRKRGQLRYQIVDGVVYGLPLEIGTSKIAPRPFFGPMAFWLKDQVAPTFAQEFS